jgi:2-polyprenyl-6-methoxyphenol hydroxylase-like FAD-dependent oxidoreductase
MHVLIHGAGIAGPTLATLLARSLLRSSSNTAHSITVLERAPSLLPHGQNVDITGCAVTIMRRMGLLSRIRALNTTESGTAFVNGQGRAFARFPVKEGGSVSPSSEFEILRGDLARVLGEAAGEEAGKGKGVRIEYGVSVRRVLENSAEGGVRVELSSGEVLKCDLLVAADGQWSRIRSECFAADEVEVVDKGMYAVYFTVPKQEGDGTDWAIYHGLRSRIVTLRPDPHGTMRAMFTHMPIGRQEEEWKGAVRADRKTQQELVKRDFADAGWQAQRLLGAMDSAPDFYFQAIQQIRMARWSTGRVVCLGDAAFAPTPLTGMGTSLAIISAYVLAGELGKLKEGEDLGKALAAYEDVLRPFVEQVQEIPSFIPGVAHPEKAWQRWLLQSCFWTISKALAIPRLINLVGGNRSAEERTDGFELPHYPHLERNF